MKTFLRGVFARACLAANYVGDAYDYAGLAAWRVMTDKSFFDIDSRRVHSPALRAGVEWYDRGIGKAQTA